MLPRFEEDGGEADGGEADSRVALVWIELLVSLPVAVTVVSSPPSCL